MASMAESTEAKAVTMMKVAAWPRARACLSSSMPSVKGMKTSLSTTSKRVASSLASASAADAAVSTG